MSFEAADFTYGEFTPAVPESMARLSLGVMFWQQVLDIDSQIADESSESNEVSDDV